MSDTTKWTIAVLGAGSVGGTLGRRWSEAGHTVRYGVRNPAKYPDLDARPVAEAVAGADVVVLATPWFGTEEALREAGDLRGVVVVDATNPIAEDFSNLTVGHTDSAGEQVARWAPDAKVVKAFNTIGFNIMEAPSFGDGPATLLVAGDDEDAKGVVKVLAADLAFDPVDAGPLVQARLLEAMAWLWITMAMKHGHGREIAFRLMKR